MSPWSRGNPDADPLQVGARWRFGYPCRTDPDLKCCWIGDAAIRWQTLRDLKGAAERTVRVSRGASPRQAGARGLLALQDADGRWAGGIYTPKWTSTTYTMVLLASLGLAPGHPQAMRACQVAARYGFSGRCGHSTSAPLAQKAGETCVSGMLLASALWFGMDDPRVDGCGARHRPADGRRR